MASAIEFSVCPSVCLFVCSPYVTNFLILLQHNIRPLSHNCGPCAIEFVAGMNLKTHFDRNCKECATEFAASVNLKRHDTLRRTVWPYDILAHSTQ